MPRLSMMMMGPLPIESVRHTSGKPGRRTGSDGIERYFNVLIHED